MQAVISYFIGLDEHILALAYLFAAVLRPYILPNLMQAKSK